MLWTTLYSPLVLHTRLSPELYNHWVLFSEACSILCRPYVTVSDIDRADGLLLEFCVKQEQLYGPQSCTPNMHMHCHLKDCIMDVGPLHLFWCFSFERYNGILEKMQKTWQSPEIQLAQKFCNLQMLSLLDLPDRIPAELTDCLKK